MRKLLLLRGLPGSGKSHFVRENGLAPYTLSADVIRTIYGGPILQANGKLRTPGDYDRAVWQQLLEMLENRKFRGELVVVDATHTHPRSFSNYQQFATKHRYQVALVDFSEVPFELCQQRNNARAEYTVVPELEMERMADNMKRTSVPRWIKTVRPEDLNDYLKLEPKDISRYKAVHHIGDIQGCFDPLNEYFVNNGIKDDELYIFVGDYLDRGTQNAEVMNWLLDNYHRENFVFIEGNHEAHLRNWTKGIKARSAQFNQATAIELEAAGISPKKVYGFLYKLREVYFYQYNGKKVVVTHGGISTLPARLSFIASTQFIKGTGLYEESEITDASFAATTEPETYQLHGHRNQNSVPTRVNERCFNLEGKVEFGGQLRVVVLNADGFTERSVDSHIDSTNSILESVGDGAVRINDVETLVQQLRASTEIYEKPQDLTNISSFNFKRDVFYRKSWDSLNVHARGLFINTSTHQIVARAYEKFFNVGERPETQPDILIQSLHFPVKVWIKENGYLGLVGYDHEVNELVFASKSSLKSDFAVWLKHQFDALAPTDSSQRTQIIDYLKADQGKTLVFEVIEPANDPHIISYDEPSLILLDVVKNTVAFDPVSASERTKVGKIIGCRTKKQARLIKDAPAFKGWLQEVNTIDYVQDGKNIEGFVLEDASGFMVKIKLPWYAFWRQMRTQLERLQSDKNTQLPSFNIDNELAGKFLEYMRSFTSEEISRKNIVELREEFLNKSN